MMIVKDNKGFSMVELIIVVAIMLMLVGVLAPQYIKYVNDSKVSIDIDNAQEIAGATGVALTDPQVPLSAAAPGTTITVTADDLPNVREFPESRVNPSYTWEVTVGSEGLERITLGGYEIWPNPDDASDGYRINNS